MREADSGNWQVRKVESEVEVYEDPIEGIHPGIYINGDTYVLHWGVFALICAAFCVGAWVRSWGEH